VKLRKQRYEHLLKARIIGKFLRFILIPATLEQISIDLLYRNYLKILNKTRLTSFWFTRLIGLLGLLKTSTT